MTNSNYRMTFVPPKEEAGVYANVVGVWHTPHEFTLDFALMGLPQPQSDGSVAVEAPVVARVKLPISVIFQLAQAIAGNIDLYEKSHGPLPPSSSERPF